MISVIFYGRNDGHGYNLHKRVALGLNCTAAVLDDPDDEIVFVDYNSDDALPTLPEALQDTLTPAARRRLRIIRVRSAFHRRFRKETHLPVLEPIARNIAIRRAHAANRWLLSSNPDMIIAMRGAGSLSALARGLGNGLYHIPRFELPEAIWETFDRRDPASAIAAARHWGRAAHLNEVVRCDVVGFDAVGDFQLMPLADLRRIHGFHESMLLGWHQDSNIAKRLNMIYGEVRDLAGEVEGYHCDHTRLATATHHADHRHNSWFVAFDGVARPDLPEQAESWGCPAERFEEIRLDGADGGGFPQALTRVLGAPAVHPYESARNPRSFGDVASDPRHVLPYVANAVATAPRHWSAAWFGADPALLGLFAETWRALSFPGEILLPDGSAAALGAVAGPPVRLVPRETAMADADILLFDFPPPAGPDGPVEAAFFAALDAERRRHRAGSPLRCFICVNAVHNGYEQMTLANLELVSTPFATRTRHGFVRVQPELSWDWTARMETGSAGARRNGVIVSEPGRSGAVVFGPHAWLPAGRYRARVAISHGAVAGRRLAAWLWNLGQIAYLKIGAEGHTLAARVLFGMRRRSLVATLDFAIAGDGASSRGAGNVEIWIWTHGVCALEISSVAIERLDDAERRR